MRFAGATWPEVSGWAGRVLLALPVGATEQHGPHLPLDTDLRIAAALADGLAEARGDVAVAPPLPYGASGEHAGFPGTASIGTEALERVLVELVRSTRTSCRGVVIVSGHGGNADALAAAARRSRFEGDDVLAWLPRPPGGAAHAGRGETSILLHLEPAAVRAGKAGPGCTEPLEELMPRLRTHGVRGVSGNGVLGDPTGATAAEGARLLAGMVDGLVRDVAEWQPGAAGGGRDRSRAG